MALDYDGDLNSAPNPSRHTFVPVYHVASERTDWVMNFIPTSSLSSKFVEFKMV